MTNISNLICICLSAILISLIYIFAGAGNNILPVGIDTLLVVLLVFLAIRELSCWYWKVNEQIRILNDIKKILKETLPQNIEVETIYTKEDN